MTKYTAKATLGFPGIDREFQNIIDLLCAHNMAYQAQENGAFFVSPLGTAKLVPGENKLQIHVEASKPGSFNRLKHDLTILIDFITQPQAISFEWTGDKTGKTSPPDLRLIEVIGVSDLSPTMRRIRFRGKNLETYAAPDQIHCRLMFPKKDGQKALSDWPTLDDNGKISWPESGKLESRIYTIRKIDTAAGTLDIDFVIHNGQGPGAAWARTACPGKIVGMLGPAGNGPQPAKRYLLIGDETGLPGIARILEGLPANVTGDAIIEVADASEEQTIDAPAGFQLHWLYRDGQMPGTTTLLLDKLRMLDLSPYVNDLFCWLGTEYLGFRDIRTYLHEDIGIPKSRLVAFAHWRRGMSEEDVIVKGPERT